MLKKKPCLPMLASSFMTAKAVLSSFARTKVIAVFSAHLELLHVLPFRKHRLMVVQLPVARQKVTF